MQSNIDQFDDVTAKTFAYLYESFPVPAFLLVERFGVMIDVEAYPLGDSVKEADFWVACWDWLIAAGYMYAGDRIRPVGFSDVVLTAKGLEVLKAVPSSLSNGQTVGDQIVAGLKSGALDAVKDGVKLALSRGAEMVPWAALAHQAFK
ncbi:hypothetical protein VVD49_13430 [Uliginosibacterium sp. H3]|uniref:DUF2513 domain-containing protein n=1 Tax=Uliginosibacterium silvisoli TaxID=3114758 RepID=A0ABU6K6W4_9RHOO|nr:hypothetical protein [Uliginosibacterium sp. H3]